MPISFDLLRVSDSNDRFSLAFMRRLAGRLAPRGLARLELARFIDGEVSA